MNITVQDTKLAWKSDDGQKSITTVITDQGKKLKSWNSDWVVGQAYEVNIKEKPSKNPKFGNEYWVEAVGSGKPDTKPSPSYTPENKNRSFALSYAKDLVIARIESAGAGEGVLSNTNDVLIAADVLLGWLDGKVVAPVNEEDLPY